MRETESKANNHISMVVWRPTLPILCVTHETETDAETEMEKTRTEIVYN